MKPLDDTMIRIMVSQISRNTAREVEVATANEGIWDRFGQHFGQYSDAVLQAPALNN